MGFKRKDNFLRLLRQIRTENYFPQKRPLINLYLTHQLTNHFKSSFNFFPDKST